MGGWTQNLVRWIFSPRTMSKNGSSRQQWVPWRERSQTLIWLAPYDGNLAYPNLSNCSFYSDQRTHIGKGFALGRVWVTRGTTSVWNLRESQLSVRPDLRVSPWSTVKHSCLKGVFYPLCCSVEAGSPRSRVPATNIDFARSCSLHVVKDNGCLRSSPLQPFLNCSSLVYRLVCFTGTTESSALAGLYNHRDPLTCASVKRSVGDNLGFYSFPSLVSRWDWLCLHSGFPNGYKARKMLATSMLFFFLMSDWGRGRGRKGLLPLLSLRHPKPTYSFNYKRIGYWSPQPKPTAVFGARSQADCLRSALSVDW